MKKWLVAIVAILALSGNAMAIQQIWLASATATADTTKVLCPQQFSTLSGRGVLHGVCIDVPIVGLSGTVSVFNSSATTANGISTTSTNGINPTCLYYDMGFSSGLSYTNSSTATIKILYECY